MIVVLPEPVGPTIPTTWPGLTSKETFFKTSFLLSYEKVRFLNLIWPFKFLTLIVS